MKYCFLLSLLISCYCSFSQELSNEANYELIKKLNRLSENRSPQNIYIQTDKDIYETSEDLWFKAYVLNSLNLFPSNENNVLFIQLINEESKKVVVQEKFRIENGVTKGHVFLKDDLIAGNYLLAGYTSSSLNNNVKKIASSKKIRITKDIIPNIIFDVDFNKKVYTENDEAIVDVFVRSKGNDPLEKANVTLELYNGKINIDKKKVKTDSEGLAKFLLDFNDTGIGSRIDVLVEYDSKKHKISYEVPILSNKNNIQFGLYPEGGNLVAGLSNNIAFKAVDLNGNPIKIKGIVYEDGKEFSNIESVYDGMGSVLITPKENKEYTVKITSPKLDSIFKFPAIKSQGIVLKGSKQVNNRIKFEITRTKQLKDKKIYARAQMRGKVVWLAKGNLNRETTSFTIPTQGLQQGIAEITIFDEDYLPIAERLVYVNHDKHLTVDYIELSDDRPGVKEKVELLFSVKDENNNPVKVNLGLSVYNHLRENENFVNTIFTHNYLFSDIKGKINNPHRFFDSKNERRDLGLNLLLLTQGWRSYNWSQENLKTIEPIIKDQAFSEDFSAVAYSKSKKGTLSRVGNVDVQFISPNTFELIKTDALGVLKVSSGIFQELEGYKFFFKTMNDTIILKKLDHFKEVNRLISDREFLNYEAFNFNVKKRNNKMLQEFSFNSINYLEEVEIVAYKNRGRHFGYDFDFKSSSTDYICWQYGILNCINHGGGPKPVPGERYALNGGGYVIYKAPEEKKKEIIDKADKDFVVMKGFYPQKQFYAPIYDTEEKRYEPDNRTTLYWNPEIITNNKGEAKVSFYTSDIKSTYIVKMEGVDENGQLCYKEIRFKVK